MKTRTVALSGLMTLLSCGLVAGQSVPPENPDLEAPLVDCPRRPVIAFLCESGEVCVPLGIEHADSVHTSNGAWQEGELCFLADSAGAYGFTVTAFSWGGQQYCDLTVVVVADCPEVTTVVDPDTLHILEANILPPLPVRLYLEVDAASYTVHDIEPATISINSAVLPDSAVMAPSGLGSEPEVLTVFLSLSKFIKGYWPVIDTIWSEYKVTGRFQDGYAFETTGQVTLVGYLSGDVNVDGSVDISDLMYLIDYFFRSGPAPVMPQPADLDGNTVLDISDLVLMIQHQFSL